MKRYLHIFSLVLILASCANCKVMHNKPKEHYYADSINGIYVPKNLTDAVIVLDTMLSPDVKDFVRDSLSEDSFTTRSHRTLGLWIRNNWGLWGDSRLKAYLNSLGISHPDDMSDIILTSWYRHLVGRKWDVESQVSHYQQYWKKVVPDRKAQKEYLKKKGFHKGATVYYEYIYGFSTKEEEGLYDKEGKCAEGRITEIKHAEYTALIKVKLIKCYSPYGILISDQGLNDLEDERDYKSFNPNDENLVFLKEGEEAWFNAYTMTWSSTKPKVNWNN